MPSAFADAKSRLATVLVADAVGFSQRMGSDVRAMIIAVLECRELLGDVVRAYGGRVVGTPGDFLLALMPSGREAVEAAAEMQSRLAERNLTLDEARRAVYRMGIGIGDVYEHGGDVLGEAVNVASRLQAIAPPGGIVVSGAVHDVVGPRERFDFEDLGEQLLKNLLAPVRAYLLIRPLGGGVSGAGPASAAGRGGHRLRRLPVKPVIVVEPFRSLAGSDAERLFADGLMEELIAILTGLSNSLVVCEVAGMTGSTAAVRAMEASQLYRLSGSVRRGEDQVRIIARLRVQGTGEAIWADRFDYRTSQSFDVQERIAREVVTSIQVALTEGEQARLWHQATTSVRAWEYFQRGHDMEQRFTRHGHQEARRCYQAALDCDPAYVSAVVALAFCHLDEIRLGWADDLDGSFAQAESLYLRAQAMAPDDPECHALLAYIELHKRNDRQAAEAMEHAVRLAPRSAELTAYLGTIYHTIGRYDEAIAAYFRAMSLSTHSPAWIATNLGYVQCIVGQLAEARESFLGVIKYHPDYVRAHLGLAVACRRLGLAEDALRAAAEVRRLDHLFSTEKWAQDRPYADPGVSDAFIADMRGVGLP